MNDREIDRLLHEAPLPPSPDPDALEAIVRSIALTADPVRPLPASWLLALELVLLYAAAALGIAGALGYHGFARMNGLDRLSVFSALAILVLISAPELIRASIPGRRRRLSSQAVLAIAGLSLAGVLFACFRDFHNTRFLHAGVVCLGLGTLTALLAAVCARVLLRRGFAVNAMSAGLSGGTFAGLAGVTMLELHCPNFETAHLLVWHVGVLLVSAALGALLGWSSRRRRIQ